MHRIFRFACVLSTALMVPLPTVAADAVPLQAAHPTQIDWSLTPEQITSTCTAQIAAFDAAAKRIMAVRGQRTFENTLLPLENAEADLSDRLVAQGFLFNMAIEKPVRDASDRCNIAQSNYFAAFGARPDVYRALLEVQRSGTARTDADKKLLEYYLVTARQSGAALSAQKRKSFIALSNELTVLASKWQETLNNDAATLNITAAQTQSLPAGFVKTLTQNADGTYTVKVNESTVTPFLQNQRDAGARKAFFVAYNNRAVANVAVLQSAIGVRYQLARLLGYDSWAAYRLADRMAKTPEQVLTFERSLDAKLMPQAKRDLEGLAQMKGQDTGDANAAIEPWDVAYYYNQLVKTKYSVDNEEIRQYFPVDVVIDRIMNLYHKILGVTFVKVADPKAWAPDVISYNVFDTKTGKFIGTTYFDLYPRPGKFSHFANWPLLPARKLKDGTYRPPVTAILGNWPRPAPGSPALLSHQDVITFFHEFGHNLAALLGTAPYETLSGGFRQDFVEAPSQMLENFMWQPSILKEISANVTTGAPLPDDLIAKMIAARYVDEAYFTTGQIKLGMVDMTYHSSGPKVDTTAVWGQISSEYTPLAMVPGTHPQASFGHLFGYDAGYYSYLWALVYAQDMFTAFKNGGLEDPDVGLRYRQTILEPARTYEPDVEVRNFLGRPMNTDAFYEQFVTAPDPAPTPH
ncbi:MAG TPA: M3 family metallopeptidase [Candidatus Baltobacteraceae bacterium]|nr:M3 family metallopeptidase [Candidatus Baltobacteraceae bacterium]